MTAVVRWLSGPVLRARTREPFRVHEAVRVGTRRLMGEVIHLGRDEIVVQVYEETTGLRPGDRVERTGAPLSVELGPGLLGRIFDGLLRPLSSFFTLMTPGATESRARFEVSPIVRVGYQLAPGDRIANAVREDGLTEGCFAPPGTRGSVVHVAAAGSMAKGDVICRVRTDTGEERDLEPWHSWPVREPRPVRSRLPVDRPMITGQRILDTLFPVARGGKAALPGGFGTGKTVLQQTLAKWSDADVVVYVGCGERGNEMAEVLEEFPALEDPRTGRPLLDRTVIIANTSNMPVAAREASIYTGVTVAEYLRDQGLHVALMADSTSRWAEALREISGRLGELPAEGGYPAYLSSRLADFYERAGRVRTLSGEEGSLTLIGAISPPGGDFSEPVTKHTERYVRTMWSLDPSRAHARTYPAIDPLSSYSEDVPLLTPWWESEGSADWSHRRRRLLEMLDEQSRLERMARIVGKDALPARQQLALLSAELASDAFLSQSALSPVDAHCAPARQARMLALVMRFAELAHEALERGVSVPQIAALPILRRLKRMGEEIGDDQLDELSDLARKLEEQLARVGEEVSRAS